MRRSFTISGMIWAMIVFLAAYAGIEENLAVRNYSGTEFVFDMTMAGLVLEIQSGDEDGLLLEAVGSKYFSFVGNDNRVLYGIPEPTPLGIKGGYIHLDSFINFQ